MNTTISKVFLGLFLILGQLYFGQSLHKQNFNVLGNCGLCKDRIEKAAQDAGAKTARWDAQTQELIIEYDGSRSTADAVLKNIAAHGHDNDLYKASDEAYSKLPECCLYRKESATNIKSLRYFVRGNCEQCQERIEEAAVKAGAKDPEWNAETKIIKFTIDTAMVKPEDVLWEISQAGHDNELYKAPDAVYNKLPGCCLYDRQSLYPQNDESISKESGHGAVAKAPTNNSEISLDKNPYTAAIKEVTVTKVKPATSLSRKEVGLSFNIDDKELLKAACCNLAESFETNATVDVSYSNAVTGSKQLKMLGLDQKYTYITKELLPDVGGLASAYGLNLIPGRWIEGIQLTKGGSTVTNGYQSITGQINTELVKYKDKNETKINLFADSNLRTEANIVSTQKLSTGWNQSVLLHGNATFRETDHNKDGFLDQPTGHQINTAYLLNYNDLDNSGLGTHFGINFVKDQRYGGQKGYNSKLPQSAQSLYGVGIDITRLQAWNKTGYIFKGKPYQSIGWMNQFTTHQQDSFFGHRTYYGKEKSFYSNLIFESILGNTNHKYKAGASYLYDHYDETYNGKDYKRTESVPGIFAEYTLTGSHYTLVAGARADFHNLIGTQVAPRLNIKYDLTPKTILRFALGRGYRTANVFAENQQFFASNRTIEIRDNDGDIYGLKPEIAWNYGVSLQQEFRFLNRPSQFVTDFFRTDFQNQVIVDLDQTAQKILFYNLDGSSFANSFQTQWDFSPVRNFDVRLAYKYYDVQTDYETGKRDIPFIAKHRGFLNLAYSTKREGREKFWSFDTTLQYVGKQRIPDTSRNPIDYQFVKNSEAYTTLNAQIAYQFSKTFRWYVGGENLTGYTQSNPILDAENPFGAYFDSGMIYAPIMPANVYMGIDLTF